MRCARYPDEAAAGLDFAGITAMLNLLDDLYRAGTALIVSTHDTDLAYEWADDAWILYKGSLAAQGPIGDVVLNEILPDAHLRIPTTVELGRALREAHPELANQPLPRTREEMLEMIRQTSTEASAKPPRIGDRTISTTAPAAKVISFCPTPGGPTAPGVRKIALS